ncbi:hypothetical protein WMY93_030413 [Mugilogobius chulae]|uniref:Uncharacterized protein n=1 Tax=Mugilogobius chulae TaxID=88201 RepID=A0AAW0MHN3_9GOBI
MGVQRRSAQTRIQQRPDSVDISDRDWQCFFSQCEECNVLQPSLAGLEDSGMSDMDELGALFAKMVQKSDFNSSLQEEGDPAGSACEGPLRSCTQTDTALGA